MVGKVSSTIGLLLAFAAPIAELAGVEPISLLDDPVVRWAGAALVVAGILATLAAQLAMGSSWRGDVDPEARTALVIDGPFKLVRNPIFTCTAAIVIGLALMVPNVLALLMLIAFIVSLEVQVRLVEEPYLERVHGDAYRTYAARTGRFLPGVGRLRRPPT
jgi:protein-S-isoprenylcysteine O-methyltransferase Ste14